MLSEGEPHDGGNCEPACYVRGTCYEPLGRCDCPAGWTGGDCLTPFEYTHFMPGFERLQRNAQQVTCALFLCVSHCVFHCVSLTVSPSLCLSLCLPHCVSHRPRPSLCLPLPLIVSLALWLSLCLPHRISRTVALTVSAPLCLPRQETTRTNREASSCRKQCGQADRGFCFWRGPRRDEPTCLCVAGWGGEHCQRPVRSYCVGGCGGRGLCRAGFCRCDPGWFGVDCGLRLDAQGRQQRVAYSFLNTSAAAAPRFAAQVRERAQPVDRMTLARVRPLNHGSKCTKGQCKREH